jgi:hypothetical protein
VSPALRVCKRHKELLSDLLILNCNSTQYLTVMMWHVRYKDGFECHSTAVDHVTSTIINKAFSVSMRPDAGRVALKTSRFFEIALWSARWSRDPFRSVDV